MTRWAKACAGVGLLLPLLFGCAAQTVSLHEGPREYVATDYENVLRKWTRTEHLIALSELDNFLKRKVEIRKELRQVRRQLDAEIEALGTRLKLVNIVLMPLLVTLAALAFAWWRGQRRRAAMGDAA